MLASGASPAKALILSVDWVRKPPPLSFAKLKPSETIVAAPLAAAAYRLFGELVAKIELRSVVVAVAFGSSWANVIMLPMTAPVLLASVLLVTSKRLVPLVLRLRMPPGLLVAELPLTVLLVNRRMRPPLPVKLIAPP